MLQNALATVRNVFATMPMPSRIIAGLLIAVIVLALGFLVRGSGQPSSEFLLGGRLMDEKDLDAAEVAFGKAGLQGWQRDGRRIKIPSASRSEYLAALDEATSLPISLRTSVQAAIDASNPFESSAQRGSREMHAKERDLGNKISAFADVRWASVEYDLGERTGLSRSRPQSASVMVVPEGTESLSAARVDMIKELIRGAYAGMSANDVVVIDANSTSVAGSVDEDDPMTRKRRETEISYEQKIRSHLSGYGPIHVKVSAEIDPSLGVEKAILKYADQPTTLSETSRKRESESSRPIPGGVPGTQPNALSSNRPVKLDATAQTSSTKDDERTSEKVAGQEYETSRVAALQVKRVSVSIGLPSSYFQQVWNQEWLQANPDKPSSEIPVMQTTNLQQLRERTTQVIQTAITPLLPAVAAGEDKYPLVAVWDYPDLPIPDSDTSATGTAALTWLANSWQTLAMIGLALVALLVARGAVSSMGGSSDPANFQEGFGLELPAPPDPVEVSSNSVETMEITGGSLKSELVALVENNPEVAANVIRAWIGDAA